MKNIRIPFLVAAALLSAPALSPAKMDLVTLPKRDMVQLTIYNSEDLTLVRDSRALTLAEGANTLQFSWANTLIDPTSLDLRPRQFADQIDVLDLVYPPRASNLGVWNITSRISGKAPMDILYFTSGLSWRAFYLATLSSNETTMNLQGYVVVQNQSGEDYENAQTRLIVGKVNLLDQIAELSRRQFPYGRPGMLPPPVPSSYGAKSRRQMELNGAMMMAYDSLSEMEEPKEIKKEGLSEYFLYTIPGTETIPNGWSKRLLSFDTSDISVKNLYKYEEERFGSLVKRYLSFKNDEEHKLGETPIPGGSIKAYRQLGGPLSGLSFEGTSSFKYIPVGEDIELDLGGTEQVLVKPTLMDYGTSDYVFDNNGDIAGWLETSQFKVEVNNTREVAARIEITRNFPTSAWAIKNTGAYGAYEKVDLDTVKYTLDLPARTKRVFQYVLITRHGTRADETKPPKR